MRCCSSPLLIIRQLEAVVRIAESLAKMKLQAVAGEEEVDEALRLFQEDQEMISRIEKQLKRRFAIGSQVSEHSIIQDFTKQKYPEHAILKVLHLMMRRGELQHRMQRKVLYRVNVDTWKSRRASSTSSSPATACSFILASDSAMRTTASSCLQGAAPDAAETRGC
ncbi:hypothetical protein CRUP_008297 [Coryphaenoides rupestris]|nr:hypothetical protein CRUP_008297 [Coryphaenoides rupestris]